MYYEKEETLEAMHRFFICHIFPNKRFTINTYNLVTCQYTCFVCWSIFDNILYA